MRTALVALTLSAVSISPLTQAGDPVLSTEITDPYVSSFNKNDNELYKNSIPNKDASAFLKQHIPLFECPDKEIEEIYYFRWWTYRKHLKKTPDGWVVTEFLPKVNWSSVYNVINCPAGHQIYEGRWLRDPVFIRDYIRFYFTHKGAGPRRYSFWAADATLAFHQVQPDLPWLTDTVPMLVKNYEAWEKSHREPSGLFHQRGDRDGMEISGSTAMIGKDDNIRPTINSYMYGDANAIAQMAQLTGKKDIAKRFSADAKKIRSLTHEYLWNDELKHFLTRPRDLSKGHALVREQIGFVPWYFHLPEKNKGYEVAWKQLTDPKGFQAPYGPTTVEQRHKTFKISYKGHECQWNGPSWPLSTTHTLKALANAIRDYPGTPLSKKDYFDTLKIYTKSHRLKRPDGSVVPWIDENLNPHTGDWISRTRLKSWKNGTWDPGKGGIERGKDYNHSGYADLIITGICGIIPSDDKNLTIQPLAPNSWDYFALDRVKYHGHELTLIWDKTGKKYGKGKGLTLFVDGKKAGHADTLTRIQVELVSDTQE
jgi:hypothetical protein